MHFTNRNILLLLLTTLQLVTGVFCRSNTNATKLSTNAARMRAGFPPLKPRNLNMPSRVEVRSRIPSPSVVFANAIASASVTGYIQVDRANDSILEGFVSKSFNTTNLLGITTDDDSRMSITFTTPVNPFNIVINNPQGPYKFLGFAGDNLSEASNLSNYMVETNPTPPGSQSLPVGNNLNSTVPNSESAIWSYDSQSRLTPQWINSDGRFISPFLWFYSSLNALAIIVNKTGQPSDSYEVYFTVVLS